MGDLPAWVEAAARLPVAFAQVREDPRLDLELVDAVRLAGLGRPPRMMMVASGGCTAAALVAAGRLEELHLVDVNPAQLALTRLKLSLLAEPPLLRRAVLGHSPMLGADREAFLRQRWNELKLPGDVLGDEGFVGEWGPDLSGRYELVFAELRRALGERGINFAQVLSLPSDAGRLGAVAEGTAAGEAMDAAFDEAMALPWLERLFSPDATQNSVMPFSRHFAWRVREALGVSGAERNPFLWQMLVGAFPRGVGYDWLDMTPRGEPPLVRWTQSSMDDALVLAERSFDIVHLSNILDWLSERQARDALARAARALRPGGRVIIRQLNSSLDVRRLGPAFEWHQEQSAAMHSRDRSFFYRELHVGSAR